MNDLSGSMLGQYQLFNLIGKGGMATVYRAHQPSMDREVAIKVMSPDLADEAEFIIRFRREAQIIAQLQHPHILPVYDFGRENQYIYLVMRLMTGGSLNEELKATRLSYERVIQLTKEIASALDYAHKHGVVHRDLKPSNVLLDEDGHACLTDFGIAKMIGGNTTGLTSPGLVMGTPTYMAPEQWRAELVDARADVYAMGVMLYQMLLGQVPFAAETPHGLMYQHLDMEPPAPHTLNPALPLSVEPVLRKALAKDRHDRYASVGELARDLEYALRFPTRQPEVTPYDPAPPIRPLARTATPPPSLPPEATLENQRGAFPTTPAAPGGYSPTIRSSTPPPQPAPLPGQPQIRSALPSEPSGYRAPASPYQAPPVYEPSVPPLDAAYAGSYTEPVYNEPGYRPRTGEGGREAARLLGIIAAVVVAIAVFGGILLVGVLLLNSPHATEKSSPTLPPATPQPTSAPPGLRPSVIIQSPANGVTLTLGDTVTIQFTASSPQGVSRVELRRFGQVLYTLDAGGQNVFQGTFAYQPDSTGSHILEIFAWSGPIQGDAAIVSLVVQ